MFRREPLRWWMRMGKTGMVRMASLHARKLLCGVALGLVGGCAHHDVVDTPVTWWHQLEGGAIAQQRPPPPGVDDPYPKIGTTPAAAPQVASLDLRKSVTSDLVEQSNLSARLNAHDPLPPPEVVAKPGAAAAPAAATAAAAPPNPAISSATLDAADAPPPPSTPSAPAPAPGRAKAAAPAGSTPAAEPELAMPDLAPAPAGGQAGAPQQADAAAILPPIPAAPPAPPALPGVSSPPAVAYAPPPRPTYALAAAPGEALVFAAGTDVLSPGQAATLQSVASRRGAGTVYVHGYGDAPSDAPRDQAQALTLAALRARAVADALEKDGVPASSIRLRADAFGRGARAGLVE